MIYKVTQEVPASNAWVGNAGRQKFLYEPVVNGRSLPSLGVSRLANYHGQGPISEGQPIYVKAARGRFMAYFRPDVHDSSWLNISQEEYEWCVANGEVYAQ